jgi:hypothetical protein
MPLVPHVSSSRVDDECPEEAEKSAICEPHRSSAIIAVPIARRMIVYGSNHSSPKCFDAAANAPEVLEGQHCQYNECSYYYSETLQVRRSRVCKPYPTTASKIPAYQIRKLRGISGNVVMDGEKAE